MVTTPYEAVVALVEIVIIIIKVTHGNHTLAMVLVDFAIDAIRLDAADVCIVLITNLVGHEFHHLILDAVALGLLGGLFHIGAVFAQLLVFLLIGRTTTVLVFRQQAMHHRVRITTNR